MFLEKAMWKYLLAVQLVLAATLLCGCAGIRQTILGSQRGTLGKITGTAYYNRGHFKGTVLSGWILLDSLGVCCKKVFRPDGSTFLQRDNYLIDHTNLCPMARVQNEEGRFTIEGVPPGTYTLTFFPDNGWMPVQVEGVQVHFGKTTIVDFALTDSGLSEMIAPLVPAERDLLECFGQIAGVIRDGEENVPIPYTIIQIDGTNMGCQADSLGEYVIRNVPPGTYALTASVNGWLAKKQSNVRVSAHASTQCDFTLCPSISDLELHFLCLPKADVAPPRPDARVATYTNHTGRIEGRCTGSSWFRDVDGNPIAGLAVQVNDQSFFVETDARGKYVLENIPTGTHTLSVCVDGRLWATAVNVIVRDRNVTTVNFITECKVDPEGPCP